MEIKEDIDYYVLNNLEGSHDTYEDMYEVLNLEEEEELYQIGEMEHHDSHDSVTDEPSTPQKEVTLAEDAPTKENDAPSTTKWTGKDHDELLSPTKTKPVAIRKQFEKRPKEEVKSVKPVDPKSRSSILAANGKVPPEPPHPLPQKYAAAAAAGPTIAAVVAAQPQSHHHHQQPPISTHQPDHPPTAIVRSHADVAKPPASAPVLRTSHIPSTDAHVHPVQVSVSAAPTTTSQRLTATVPGVATAPHSALPAVRQSTMVAAPTPGTQNPLHIPPVAATVRLPAQPPSVEPSTQLPQQEKILPELTAEVLPTIQSPVRTSHPPSPVRSSPVRAENAISPSYTEREPIETTSPTGLPGVAYPRGLADLLPSLEAAKMKLIGMKNELNPITYAQHMLDVSYQNVPDPVDIERNRPYIIRQPFPSPLYYPQNIFSSIELPETYEKIDSDCLFFIFYYMAGTYHQYLAAQELKRQSWRFHTKYVTWFQRHEEPDLITDDYEQGSYIYFDHEGMWCQRKKGDFRFEYQYLEDTADV